MSPFQVLRISVHALRRNLGRSFLTALGVIIGVAAVISMVAIGEGAKAQVVESFASMGTNLLIVMPGAANAGGVRGGFGSASTLTWDDLEAIRTEIPTVRTAAPMLRGSGQVISESENWTTGVSGTSPEYFDLRAWAMASGEAFTEGDVEAGNKVVVMGQTVVENLFGSSFNPVGQYVRIGSVPFLVVGVLNRKGQSPMGQDYDDEVFMPYTTFLAKIQGGLKKYVDGPLLVSAVSAETTETAREAITTLLRDRHHITGDREDDFDVHNFAEVANAQKAGSETLTMLLASIAAVSLLVGGIGIMNIMLVSVTERTREIGLRMAVGATPSDILAQFLVEALTLSIGGGAVGTAVGIFVAHRLSAMFQWPLLIRPSVILMSFAFAALVGIVFGLYPARKAARLDPIEALRYE